MTKCNSHETHNIYPSLNAISLNDQQQFRLNKVNEIKKIILLLRLEKENKWAKGLVNTLRFLNTLISH